MPSLIEIGPVVLEKKIFKVCQFCLVISLFTGISGHGHSFEQTLNPLYPRMLCAQWFWRKRFLKFLNFVLPFYYYLPLEKSVALHFKLRESLSSKMLFAKFGWTWPSGSGEDEKVKSLQQWQKLQQRRQWWTQVS